VVRTAATNVADFAAGDLKLSRPAVMAVLTALLVAAVWAGWRFAWRWMADRKDDVLCADLGYWLCMFLAGTLGTEIGDFCSHNLKLDDGGAALLLSPVVGVLFAAGTNGRLLPLPAFWTTVVAIRAAGTAVGDYLAGRGMLGLPLSTAVTGIIFVGLLAYWRNRPAATAKAPAAPGMEAIR
jgi:uncharacterized membrane-anchored protein